MRLIDADALVQSVGDRWTDYDRELVDSFPAIDLVQCRECRFNPKHEWTGCPKAGTWREFNYDGFCSDGQRREEDNA